MREDSIAPRPLTDAEEQALFAALPENLQPIILMALHTGLRLNEILTQRWAAIDLVDAVARFIATGCRRGISDYANGHEQRV